MKNGCIRFVSVTLALIIVLPVLSASAGEKTVYTGAGARVSAVSQALKTGAIKTAVNPAAQPSGKELATPQPKADTVLIESFAVKTAPLPGIPAAKNPDESPSGQDSAAEKIEIENETLNYVVTVIKNIIKEYQNGMNDFRVYLVPVDENLQEFYADYYDNQGGYHNLAAGVFYNTETNLIYGKDQRGALRLGFDWDLNQMMFYAPQDSWHREFGFCEAYDIMSPAVGDFYKTFRVKFSFDGMDWMVQFWKGQYQAMFVGAEFGFYNKPADRIIEFYDCAPDGWHTPMAMKLYQNGRLLFERPLEQHWWMTGFRPGICVPSLLTVEGGIEFPSAGMKDSFITALETNPPAGLTYTVQDNFFSFIWRG